ncbi:MAG: ubiquinol oxidase subunit II [Pseudomonadota bacterium]
MFRRLFKTVTILALAGLLSGCNLVLLNPNGDVAAQKGDLIIYATVLMLIVIIPVMALTVFFAMKYREDNKQATYDPDWDHSISLEIVIWAVPLAIIICLAGLTWVATHRLDPYQDLIRISEDKPIDESVEPLEVHVVSLDWKWLFIYPEQNIATVNEFAAIVDRPIEFKLTSDTVMNAFYVPDLAGMIYAMAGMETELNAVINVPGSYEGFSANYSGNGFSQMNFEFLGKSEEDFDAWVEKVRDQGRAAELDQPAYNQLQQPSIDHKVTYYGAVADGLWRRIVNLCAGQQDLCLDDMMMVDALGGGGIEGLFNREMFRGICAAEDPSAFIAILRPDLKPLEDELFAAMDLPPVTDLSDQLAPQNNQNGGN